MPKKSRTAGRQSQPVVAEPLTESNTSGRTHRPAPGPSSAKRKAISGRGARPSRRGGSPSPGAVAEISELSAAEGQHGAAAVVASMPQDDQRGRNGGTSRKRTASPGVSVPSTSTKARARLKPVRLADLAPQPRAGAGLHPEEVSTADGNGHFHHDEVARLAYSYWEARGYQGGSPEDDWYQAQAELRRRKLHAIGTRPRRRTRKT